MKKNLLILSFIISTGICMAQDATVQDLKKAADRSIAKENDTTGKIWRVGGMFNITLGQTALSNWAAGGDQFSFTGNSIFNAFAFYKKGKHSWDNSLDLA